MTRDPHNPHDDPQEIRLDDERMPAYAQHIARVLDATGAATFQYAAFGTLWRMTAVNQEALTPVKAIGPTGLSGGEYTLWLRERSNNLTAGPWLNRHQLAMPSYLGEKYDCGAVDAYAIAVLILLVDRARARKGFGGADVETERTIRAWAAELEAKRGQGDALPAFLPAIDFKAKDEPEPFTAPRSAVGTVEPLTEQALDEGLDRLATFPGHSNPTKEDDHEHENG